MRDVILRQAREETAKRHPLERFPVIVNGKQLWWSEGFKNGKVEGFNFYGDWRDRAPRRYAYVRAEGKCGECGKPACYMLSEPHPDDLAAQWTAETEGKPAPPEQHDAILWWWPDPSDAKTLFVMADEFWRGPAEGNCPEPEHGVRLVDPQRIISKMRSLAAAGRTRDGRWVVRLSV